MGWADIDVKKHKRSEVFDQIDFDLLNGIVELATELVIAPNVMSETSNLLRQTKSPNREALSTTLRYLIGKAHEFYLSSRSAADSPFYLRLGITDAALLQIMMTQRDIVLLTVDHNLHLAALHSGCKSTNFNHIRDERSDFR